MERRNGESDGGGVEIRPCEHTRHLRCQLLERGCIQRAQIEDHLHRCGGPTAGHAQASGSASPISHTAPPPSASIRKKFGADRVLCLWRRALPVRFHQHARRAALRSGPLATFSIGFSPCCVCPPVPLLLLRSSLHPLLHLVLVLAPLRGSARVPTKNS